MAAQHACAHACMCMRAFACMVVGLQVGRSQRMTAMGHCVAILRMGAQLFAWLPSGTTTHCFACALHLYVHEGCAVCSGKEPFPKQSRPDCTESVACFY